ncbi:hypothetical protein Tco_1019140 [Tanacetum coccineum]|uniref:Uncharacterized protein n=1 Tax=Tanacetum coccineum TaxID=301880 RepID=A0ABQ5FWK7_9ASTR
MVKGLLGPSGGSGGTLEGRFSKHYGGNGEIGGFMFGVGEGKDESMGGIGGGSLARRLNGVESVSEVAKIMVEVLTYGIEVLEVGIVGGGPDT